MKSTLKYVAIYFVVNLVWTLNFGPIYTAIDWKSMMSVYYALAAGLLVVVWWAFLMVLHKIKLLYLGQPTEKSNESDLKQE